MCIRDSRRVAPGGPADRALVDVHNLVEMLQPGHGAVLAGHMPGAVATVGEHVVEDVVDQRGLPRARHAGHRDEHPQREAHVDLVEVVLPGAEHAHLPLRVDASARGRQLDAAPPRQVAAGQRVGAGQQVVERAGVDDLSAVLTGPRACLLYTSRCV